MAPGRRSRVPIPGAPFAQWGIVVRKPPRGWPPIRHEIIELDGGEGIRRTFLGDAILAGHENRIHVRLVSGVEPRDRYELLRLLERERNNGDMGLAVSPEEATQSTEPVVIRDFHLERKLKRCVQVGCDNFGGWHSRSQADLHIAHDMGGGDYVCRLRFVDGRWQPEVQASVGGGTYSGPTASQLLSDLQWITREARLMNEMRLKSSRT